MRRFKICGAFFTEFHSRVTPDQDKCFMNKHIEKDFCICYNATRQKRCKSSM